MAPDLNHRWYESWQDYLRNFQGQCKMKVQGPSKNFKMAPAEH